MIAGMRNIHPAILYLLILSFLFFFLVEMVLKFSLWTFLTTALCLVAPSVGEIQPHSMAPDSTLDGKDARYVLLPRILSLALKSQDKGHRSLSEQQRLSNLLKILERNSHSEFSHQQKKRKFPEIDSRGFDEDIFDEGFGDWSPMKRW